MNSLWLILFISKTYKKKQPEKAFSGIPLYLTIVSPSDDNSLISISPGLAGILITTQLGSFPFSLTINSIAKLLDSKGASLHFNVGIAYSLYFLGTYLK